MKVTIIPDIHNRSHIAEHIIRQEKPDQIVFLGDYFDSWNDELNPDLIRETAKWFAWSVNQPNRIHLTGNHDLPYWFPNNKYLWCPGFSRQKLLLVEEFVKPSDWRMLKFYHNLDDTWLLSHAGAHPQWVKFVKPGEVLKSDIRETGQILKRETEQFLLKAGRGEFHWFVAWSRARSGTLHPGGLVWNDFGGDFHSIIGVNQLVGHTHDEKVRWIYRLAAGERQKWHEGPDLKVQVASDVSYNLCLDTGLQEYAVWNGRKLTIKSVSALVKKTLIGNSHP